MEDRSEFREMLGVQARQKRTEWQALQERRKQLDREAEQLRAYIDRLNPLLSIEGLDPIVVDAVPAKQHNAFGAPGNRSTNMPPRRPAYRDMTLADATAELLTTVGHGLHADQMVREIFEITSTDDEFRAKHSLVSTLATGAKTGRWKRVSPNTYQAAQTERAPADRNQRALSPA